MVDDTDVEDEEKQNKKMKEESNSGDFNYANIPDPVYAPSVLQLAHKGILFNSFI